MSNRLDNLKLTLLIVKTYCVDAQVADSACTSTAYLSGVKTKYEMIGLNANAELNNCSAQVDEENLTESIVRWAQKSCKSTGIVTTTRITHASPAGDLNDTSPSTVSVTLLNFRSLRAYFTS